MAATIPCRPSLFTERERERQRVCRSILRLTSPLDTQTAWRQMAHSKKYSTLTLFPYNFFCLTPSIPKPHSFPHSIFSLSFYWTVARDPSQLRACRMIRVRQGRVKREKFCQQTGGCLYKVLLYSRCFWVVVIKLKRQCHFVLTFSLPPSLSVSLWKSKTRQTPQNIFSLRQCKYMYTF